MIITFYQELNMRYFIATEQEPKPLIVWNLVASSTAQLIELGLEDNPLVLPEDSLPDLIFGVCPLKIEGGELVDRTTGEMDDFEVEWTEITQKGTNAGKIVDVNTGHFTYDSTNFPMDEVSRLFYAAISNQPPAGDVKCMTTSGALYNLTNANIGDFITEYYKKLRALAQPPV